MMVMLSSRSITSWSNKVAEITLLATLILGLVVLLYGSNTEELNIVNRRVNVSLVGLNKDGGREIDACSSAREEDVGESYTVIN